ncbi:hypothetical protein [Ralstonia sp. ASV6]|uniref:hypothetical protein n=1 Tax=Ralstonia sp. ASV6 TaxID=2795124 RepID=UPI0018EAD989|nr:hypothetical protein [Ralstonia sp. ASV6]
MIDADKYPQLAKMEEVHGHSQAIGEFIDWLNENGLTICSSEERIRGVEFYPVMETTEQLLARHFGVDLGAAERERREVLAEFQASQQKAA